MDKINKNNLKTIMNFLLILVAITWGTNYVVVKTSTKEMSPLIFNTVRYVIGSITCWVIMLFTSRENIKINKKEFRKLVILGIIHIFNQLTFVYGLRYTAAGIASIILASTPVWVILIAHIFKIERVNKKTWIGIIISFIGCIIVVTKLNTGILFNKDYYIGNILVIMATICWSVYTVLVKQFFKDASIVKVTAYSISFGAIIFIMLAAKTIINTDLTAFSMQAWLGAILSGVLVFGISYTLWNIGIRIVGTTRTSVYANLPPFVSILFGWLILGEKITMIQIVGGLFILYGLRYVNKKSSNSVLENINK